MTLHQPRYDVLQTKASPWLTIDDMSLNVGGAPIPVHAVQNSLSVARAALGTRADSGMHVRYDSDGQVLRQGALDEFARRNDADLIMAHNQLRGDLGPSVYRVWREYAEARIDALTDEGYTRRDAQGYVTGGVGAFPRDLDFVRAKVWEEARQELSFLSLFPQDTSVPLGARTHTARRRLGRGRAKIMRGDSFVPRATIGLVEEQFGVAYVVCGVGQNFFETLTSDFANLNAFQEGLRMAKRLVEERLNDIGWWGDVASNIYGILNYPSLAKKVLPLAYDDTVPSPADKLQLIQQLQDLGNIPVIRSGTRYRPNRVVTSPAMVAFLSTRKHETSGGTDTTMLEYYLRTNTLGITQVEQAPELAGIGPLGEDGILFYRDNPDAVHNVMIQAPTTLPVFQSGPFDQLTTVYAATGGVVMGDVGHHILGYARVMSF